MDIVFFTHPKFLQLRSMDIYAAMLCTGMKDRGHNVQIWCPKPILSNLPFGKFTKKWLGYVDQYLIFPILIHKKIRRCNDQTLFVFTDQALGPWIKTVRRSPHVVHCHDFLALRSAMGEIPENQPSWTGRQYQNYIRRGFLTGKNFISISENTKKQLNRFLFSTPVYSEVIYNGLRKNFKPYPNDKAKIIIQNQTGIVITSGYILHVGGNQWYKNRIGVIEIYDAWRKSTLFNYHLLLIGDHPSTDLVNRHNLSPYHADIHFLPGIKDELISYAYAGASVLLFPSYAEGFGWPIVEAMASGCKVITTEEPPMTEVAANACFYISRRPSDQSEIAEWATSSAKVLEEVITLSPDENKAIITAGILNAARFNADTSLDQIEIIYKKILTEN